MVIVFYIYILIYLFNLGLCRALFCLQTKNAPAGDPRDSASAVSTPGDSLETKTATADPTIARVIKFGSECTTPKEAQTNLLGFLTQSDIQKRTKNIDIPYFEGGCHLSVTYADRSSPTGISKFVGICISRRNKGLGTTFILRNVIGHVAVERMFELYSPIIRKIEVLRLERRRRAKLYYLRDKPLKYSTVDWNAEPDTSTVVRKYKRAKDAPA